jgi:pyruvate/2-oxoglutarate dehydrogenase complex dihydrolipoamide acyltransferase (E2) component
MARRFACLVHDNPDLNATILGADKYLYDEVRLGFTVMVGSILYLAVVDSAATMGEREFVNRLGELQRSAVKHALKPTESSDPTVSFSSMARWRVTRHVPVLPPYTALIVAHTAPRNGVGILGASYDHRLLTGFDVVQALYSLSRPPEEENTNVD